MATTTEKLCVGQDRTTTYTVTARDTAGAAITGVYSGSETLALEVWPKGGSAVSLSGSGVAWLSASAGTITLTLDNSDMAALSPGPYELSITVTVDGEPIEVYHARLLVTYRP